MLKSYQYRIYPNKKQELLINQHIGCCRFVYNNILEAKLSAYKNDAINLSWVDLARRLPGLKKEYTWLKGVNSQSLQQSIKNMDAAFRMFYKVKKGFPKFKKKGLAKQSFHVPQNVSIQDDKLIIPKFKKGINIVLHRPLKGEVRQATISRKPTGKYFVCILCETGEIENQVQPITELSVIGVDLGLKSFIVTSNGAEYKNPKFLHKSISKLKYNQRQYSKLKGKRRKHKIALLYEKITNQRKDFLNKVSTELIRENQSIALEDLNIKGMLKNHCLAGSITDVSWGAFVSMLKYKAKWNGVNVLRIGRFEPSSKTCSECGYINKELTLKDREWACPECGCVLDRDVNAAINIKKFALNNLCTEHTLKSHGTLPSVEGALTHEPCPLNLLTTGSSLNNNSDTNG